MFNRTTSTFSELGVLCVFARVIVYPIFSSSRQDAKTAKSIRSRSSLASFAPLRENVLIRFLFLIAPRRQDRKDYSFSFFLGVLCAFARECSYPIPLSYRAKMPRPQRKIFSYFSELRVLCAFARGVVYPIFSSSRQDAKKTFLILLIGVLCAFARVFFPIP
jgi:hypothetical protein